MEDAISDINDLARSLEGDFSLQSPQSKISDIPSPFSWSQLFVVNWQNSQKFLINTSFPPLHLFNFFLSLTSNFTSMWLGLCEELGLCKSVIHRFTCDSSIFHIEERRRRRRIEWRVKRATRVGGERVKLTVARTLHPPLFPFALLRSWLPSFIANDRDSFQFSTQIFPDVFEIHDKDLRNTTPWNLVKFLATFEKN